MTRFPVALFVALLCMGATSAPERETALGAPRLSLERNASISSSTNGLAAASRRLAGTDSFVIYGGPGTLEGKFQDGAGHPDWQGWEGVDRTETPVYWQVSTHNAANLGDHGAGNRAYWCGQTAEQAPHWFHTPGYGSSWNATIMYESEPVADPTVGQTLSLDFLFNIDVEPGYDFLQIEAERGGEWFLLTNTYDFDGTNRDINDIFQAPGMRFSDLAQSTFDFLGNDYGGESGDRIRVRIAMRTDGAFDDQTGLWPTIGGAAQIDDISLSHDGASFFEDFEGPGPWLFQPVLEPFVGDFSEMLGALTDIDPYHKNTSPVAVFVDRGQELRNGPGLDGSTSTGGTTSPNWSYGVAGGYVVNHTGGLSAGIDAKPLRNEIWSPWIDWDLPGTEDDDVDIQGAVLSFDVYNHLMVSDGIFFEWGIGPGGGSGTLFNNDNTVYFSHEGPLWERFEIDVSEYLNPAVYPQVRISLGVQEYAEFVSLPGGDATPAPYFDNVKLVKYVVGGLRITSDWNGVLFNEWPDATNLNVSTPTARDALDINISGDATIMRIIYRSRVDDVRMVWALRKNPLFEDAIRLVPALANDENVVTGTEIWTGERISDTSWGESFSFDGVLWRAFYPGDQLEYYIQATDLDGRVTTLPPDLSGFGTFDGSYDSRFSTRGLPSIQNPAGDQPRILVYAGGGERTDLDLVLGSLTQLGMIEGVDFDVHWRVGGSSAMLGDLAGLEDLAGYETIMVFGGGGSDYTYREWSISATAQHPTDRIGIDDNTMTDFTDWSALPGDRNLVFFGSLLGYSMTNGVGMAPSFLASEMGVQLVADDLRPQIANQASPGIAVLGAGFTADFVVSGSDKMFLALDHVEPIAPAVRAHGFKLPGGDPHPTAAASILKVETVGADTKIHLTFPYAFRFIQLGLSRAPVGLTARAQLLAEVLDLIQAAAPSGAPTSAPVVRDTRMQVSPNPFNPRTTVSLTLARRGAVTLQVFDVRGRLVRTLHRGDLDPGPSEFVWDGHDDRGATLASGVYLVRARLQNRELREKVLLVK